MIVNSGIIKESKASAALAIDELTTMNQRKHYAKVCCVCDSHIGHGRGEKLSFEVMKGDRIQPMLKKNPVLLSAQYQISDTAARLLCDQYTPKCLTAAHRNARWLTSLYLSPRSYYVSIRKKRNSGLGCCKSCKKALTSQSKKADYVPTNAIANGLMIGSPPPELTALSDVELAMVSLARINRHVFSFDAGAHKHIVGWHCLFANDVESVSKVANWSIDRLVGTTEDSDDEDDSVTEDSEGDDLDLENENGRPRLAKITVILSGPFTNAQRSLALSKCQVDFEKIRVALDWLKANNRLYKELDISAEDIEEPIRVENINIVAPGDNNIETVYEMHAVFPDGATGLNGAGGFSNREEFKANTVDQMIESSNTRKATIISRPTKNILRDYQGDNLLRAFPLQFPYGIGSTQKCGDPHAGVTYMKLLMSMSQKQFHRPDFCCVMHNMFERQKMVQGSYMKHSDKQASSYNDVSNADIDAAVSRFLDGCSGGSPADLFLSKMKAVTSSMGHTVGASKQARQKMYAYIMRFGMPAILFTITSEDGMNFRIRIYAKTDEGESEPPFLTQSETLLREFMHDSKNIRREYPGLCALDYENVLRITIEHLIGWDRTTNQNNPNKGLFGDVDAYCVATEEQGRKTLHGHILIWLKLWKKLWEMLGTCEGELLKAFETTLINYAKSIMTTKVFGTTATSSPNPCGPDCARTSLGIANVFCASHQDLRNLRMKQGLSTLDSPGSKAILRCGSCETSYTSEDVAVSFLKKKFGPDRILSNPDVRPSYDQDFWEKNLRPSTCGVYMEMHLMRALVPHQGNVSKDHYNEPSSDTKCIIAILRNLHRTSHSRACFKKGEECRMKIPAMPSDGWNVKYHPQTKSWQKWNGTVGTRNIFVVEPARGPADCFANIHNPHVSDLFGCNNNVVAAVDGGSPMYLTAYHSKNTQKEDNERFGKAASAMIRKLNERYQLQQDVAHENDGDSDIELPDPYSVGVKAMIGAVLHATGAHTCAAPMAAFLIRNGSRFEFSHSTVYTRLQDFFSTTDSTSFELASNDDGQTFVKSHVSNYVCRPAALEDLCLYDFLSQYYVCRPQKKSLEWGRPHPNKNNQKVLKIEGGSRIPMINFMDFVDTKGFMGEDMLTCDIPAELQARHYAMNEYCKKACVCFVPFRDVEEDLKTNGSYHQHFRAFVADGKLSELHESLLENLQNCRNSLRAGRPCDLLEQVTNNPVKAARQENMSVDDIEAEDALDEAMAQMLEDEQTMHNFDFPEFRDSSNTFSYSSNAVRCLGSYGCGTRLCVSSNIDVESAPDVVQQMGDSQLPPVNVPMQGGVDSLSMTNLHDLTIAVVDRVTDPELKKDGTVPAATGTLQNIRAYADDIFINDVDQKTAFEGIVASFVLKLYEEAHRNDPDGHGLNSRQKRRCIVRVKKQLEKVNRGDQMICFLSGAGGTGKSFVITAVVKYAKNLCKNLGVDFSRRTIVVTAITGSAAVSIRGETVHSAAALRRRISEEDIEDWKGAYMIIIDEISFASKSVIQHINRNLRSLKEEDSLKFGGLAVVFAGDLSQLRPVGEKVIYLEQDFEEWDDWVHTFYELRTNHRFENDPQWGSLLANYRNVGPTEQEVKLLNTRVIDDPAGPSQSEIPANVTYATKTNRDRTAINDGIFARHLSDTHSKDVNVVPPKHTICIKSSQCQWVKRNKEYVDFNSRMKDLFHATVGEFQCKSNDNKCYDPMLKLYHGRPVMINENIDVPNGIANGSMSEFHAVILKNGVSYEDLERIRIDDYYVWCASVEQIESIRVKLVDGLDFPGQDKYYDLKPSLKTVFADIPIALDGTVGRLTKRRARKCRFRQFALVCANARTIHKLQGRSLEAVVISTWDYTDNWIYVALSRVRTMSGLFLRLPLEHSKCRPMSREIRQFMDNLRAKGAPEPLEL